jgi:hypothetical protein
MTESTLRVLLIGSCIYIRVCVGIVDFRGRLSIDYRKMGGGGIEEPGRIIINVHLGKLMRWTLVDAFLARASLSIYNPDGDIDPYRIVIV